VLLEVSSKPPPPPSTDPASAARRPRFGRRRQRRKPTAATRATAQGSARQHIGVYEGATRPARNWDTGLTYVFGLSDGSVIDAVEVPAFHAAPTGGDCFGLALSATRWPLENVESFDDV